jgi:hypothetical protein
MKDKRITINKILLTPVKRNSIFYEVKVIYIYIYIFILGLINASCVSNVEVVLSKDETFLVVNSINFQPDSTWLIEVSRSTPFIDTSKLAIIDNAQVHIKDEDGVEIQLEPVMINTQIYYSSTQKPEIDKRYELTVHAPGFPSVKASSKIPETESVSILDIKVDSTYLKEVLEKVEDNPDYLPDFTKHVPCKASFLDPSNERNFYELRLFYGYNNSAGILKYGEFPFLNLNGVKENFLIEDTQFNGTLNSFNFYIPLALFLTAKKIYVSLRILSPDYFKYLNTKNLQDDLIEDPFAQPVIVHNNIENGAGIFAGFSTLGWTLEKPVSEHLE